MKRIINRTAKTQVLCYGEGGKNQLRLQKFSATSPLAENHPLFIEAGLQSAVTSGRIQILSDEEYKKSINAIRANANREAKILEKKTIGTKMVENEQAIRAAEEHNKFVKMQDDVNKIANKVSSSRDITAESLVDIPKLKKVPVPARITLAKDKTVNVEKLDTPSAPNVGRSLAEEVANASTDELVAKLSRKERKKQKKQEGAQESQPETKTEEPEIQ